MESTGDGTGRPIDYQRFFDISFDLCCVVGDTHFIEVNKAWEKKLGYSREELLSTPWADLIYPEDRERSLEFYNGMTTPPESGTYTNRYVTKRGQIIWLEWSFTHCEDDGRTYGAARDVTCSQNMEMQLKASIRDLQRSNRDLEQFAYAASHDLQTPLRKVKNFALLLQKEFGSVFDDLPEQDRNFAHQYLRFLVEGAEKSQELINGLLHFSRTGRTLEPDTFSLQLAIDDALFILSEDISDKGVSIHVEPMPEVTADKSLMVRIFQNLIGNAIKFRADGRRPEITLGAKDLETHWLITVKDNGIGIDQRHHERVFVIFTRIGQKKQGVGLGLALCKRIVERHGGRIWFRSAVGEGTTFFFTLPKEFGNGAPS
jgi:PAS domain S-box-containing protein